MSEIKTTKKYSDFMTLQDLVNEQALKQSDLFTENSINIGVADDTNRSYRNTIQQEVLFVPRLEEPSSMMYSNRSQYQPGSSQALNTTQQTH